MNTFNQTTYIIGRKDVNCNVVLKTIGLGVIIPRFKIKCAFIIPKIILALSPQTRRHTLPGNIKSKLRAQLIH